jgi:hypothetical protein
MSKHDDEKRLKKEEKFVDPNWKEKYDTLEEFYKDNYPSDYYEFEKFELTIDPMETEASIEAYDEKRQQLEIKRCALSFNYFCHKYVKIAHPIKGLLPFITYGYQRHAIRKYDENRFNIIRKFRQGGLTTVTTIWALWRCLFKMDETIMVVSKTDREAIAAGEIVKRAIEELPSWMAPMMSKNNDHQKIFDDTGCKLFFYTPEAARGRSISFLIIDEAAFIPNMHKFWNDVFPTISTGGSVIAVSTVNGVGNWYEEMYHQAERKENDFNIIQLDYTQHPEYNDEEWVRIIRSQLGEKGFAQEVLGDFLGGGDTFIPSNILNDLDLAVREIDPVRYLFEDWANKATKFQARADKAAMLVWREPIPGREYIMGVDAAEGIGEDGDNSTIEVIDANTGEQCAQFYSNNCPLHIFSQIVAQVGMMYNLALCVVEKEKCGLTVLSKLEHDLDYENLYYDENHIAGLKTTKNSRPMLLETLQTRLLMKSIIIRSRRTVYELKHFIFNKATKKAEAPKGYHDDSIMSLCFALFLREIQGRSAPIAGDGMLPEEMTETFKAQVYEEIKKELERGSPETWLSPQELYHDEFDVEVDEAVKKEYKRPFDTLFREFGW